MPGRATVTLRSGGIEQVPLIGEMMRAAFDPAFGEAWTDAQLAAQLVGTVARVTLAYVDGEAAGFSLLRVVADEAELLLIATVPSARAQGVGGALLDAALADAAASGAAALFLEVRQGNSAERLYTARGFRCVGERRDYYRGNKGLVSNARTFRRDLVKPAPNIQH